MQETGIGLFAAAEYVQMQLFCTRREERYAWAWEESHSWQVRFPSCGLALFPHTCRQVSSAEPKRVFFCCHLAFQGLRIMVSLHRGLCCPLGSACNRLVCAPSGRHAAPHLAVFYALIDFAQAMVCVVHRFISVVPTPTNVLSFVRSNVWPDARVQSCWRTRVLTLTSTNSH